MLIRRCSFVICLLEYDVDKTLFLRNMPVGVTMLIRRCSFVICLLEYDVDKTLFLRNMPVGVRC